MARETFRDNVVVITGGSAGIGRELAIQLASEGACLVLAARDASLLDATASEARERGGRVITVPTDVAVESQCRALIERAMAEYARIDTLINNAGISMHARFDELGSVEPLELVMQINYFGSVYCTHYALPHLIRARGRIVAISSLAGRTGVPTRTAYSASKHAMAGFFDSLRIELSDAGVSVTVVYPGFVATDIASRSIGPQGKLLGHRPIDENAVMSAEECARRIIRAAAERRRQLVMTRRARIAQWVRLVAPDLIDRIAKRAIERGR